jgi:hypothetical protein
MRTDSHILVVILQRYVKFKIYMLHSLRDTNKTNSKKYEGVGKTLFRQNFSYFDVLQVAESAGCEPTFDLGLISFGVDAVRVDAAEREAAGGAPVLGKNLADGGAKLAPPHHSPRVEVAVVEVERREAPQVVPAAGEPERAVGLNLRMVLV